MKIAIFPIILWLFFVYGWVANIIAIIDAGPMSTWGGLVLARCLGVFIFPLGCILGFF